ncbi:MAG TPA: O-antigen ligase family protein, partial [Candidatus Paceibacterota bacterium]
MNIDRFLLWGARIAVGLILLEPLVMGPFGLTFSLWPKALFFRALVEIAFIFYIFLLWRNPREYMPRFSVLAWALTAFVGAVLLASVFGIHFSQSFWGDAYRTEGFIFYFHLLVFFFILSGVLSKKAEWLWLFRGVVGAGAIASVLGLLQAFHISLPFVYMVDPGRVSSTLANPVFFGGYLTLFLFIGLLLFLEEKKRVVRFAVSAAVALGLAALILSGTRGAWVGLGLGLAVFFGSVLFFAGANRRLVLKIGVFVLLGLVLAGIVLVSIPAAQEWRIIQRATHFPIGELQSRLVGWTVAFDAFKERPLFGWGPESFVILFDKFFKPEYVIAIGENTFFDRAHNQPLHLLATVGLVGGGAYLFIFFAFGWLAWKNRARMRHPFAVFAIWAFLAGSFTQNLFAFDTISTLILFFLLAAFVHAGRETRAEKPGFTHRLQTQRGFSLFLLFSYLIFALTLLWQINIKPMHAALLIVRGARAEQTDASRSLATYKQALSQKTVYDTSFRVAVVDRLVRRFDDEKSPEM